MTGPWVPWLNLFIRAPLHPLHAHHSTFPTGLAFWGQNFQSRFHHRRKSDTGVGPTLPEKAVFPHVSQWHTERKYEVLSTRAKQIMTPLQMKIVSDNCFFQPWAFSSSLFQVFVDTQQWWTRDQLRSLLCAMFMRFEMLQGNDTALMIIHSMFSATVLISLTPMVCVVS